MNVGIKHGKDLLIPHNSSEFLDPVIPVFGLCSLKVLLSLLEGCEPRIRLLRQLAMRYNMPNLDVIIRYKKYDGRPSRTEFKERDMRSPDVEWQNSPVLVETRSSALIVNNFVTEDSSSSARGFGLEQKQYQGQGSHKERSNSDPILHPLESSIDIQPPAQPRGSRCEPIFGNHFEYTTASPQIRPSAKRTSAERECSKAVYQRWLKKRRILGTQCPIYCS
jgi:hypothetical protein